MAESTVHPEQELSRCCPESGKRTKIYVAWMNMKGRCYNTKNPKYDRYGGRGIKVSTLWKDDFSAFARWSAANGYQDNLSLDRHPDNDGDYSPDNCRWATATQQCRNRSSNKILTAFGETKTLAEWATDGRWLAGHQATVIDRLKRGWIPEDAISSHKWEQGKIATALRTNQFSGPPIFDKEELSQEEWNSVVGWGDYEVSTLGRVKSLKYGKCKILKILYSKKDGRASVNLFSKTGKGRPNLLGKLVLEAHVGPRPEGMQACHFPDPNPANCRLANLRWDTQAENNKDRTRFNKLILEIISD